MPQKTLYDAHALTYERLVQFEDYEDRLLPALSAIRALDGIDVVDFGVGTGRLARLLAPLARRVLAFDLSLGMLRVAAERVAGRPVRLVAADHRAMPLPPNCADLALEGWSFLQMLVWHRETWEATLTAALAEMQRVLRPGGTAILIETWGTGQTTPRPPVEWFRTVYDAFETAHGFQATWIRTDYHIPTRAEADELIRFFFGDDEGDAIMAAAQPCPDGSVIVPECTGLWWRTYP